MKIDMHCHVKEGSVDSKVSLEEYITLLKEKGFDGMLITDHNTYKGYRYWKEHIKGKKHTDFVVLKGIEYDTSDAGHIIVIMPEGVKMRMLEMRGLPAAVLIERLMRANRWSRMREHCGFRRSIRSRESEAVMPTSQNVSEKERPFFRRGLLVRQS